MKSTGFWARIVALAVLSAVVVGQDAVLADDSWEYVSSMANARRFHGAALGDDGFIYAVGGSEWGGAPAFSSVERYNPQTNAWSPATAMNTAREGHGVISVCGLIYAIGGADENGVRLDSMETYDVCTETWTVSPYMLNVPRAYFAVTVDHCGRIYAIGGDDGANKLASVEVFDTKNAGIGWQMLGHDLNVARFMLGAGTDQEGRIYAIAGIPAAGGPTDSVERFDPANPTAGWQPGPPLNQARQMGAWATASDGKIFVLGGWVGYHLSSVEVYDYVSDSWLNHSNTNRSINQFAAVFDTMSRLYAIGGEHYNTQTEVERLRISTNCVVGDCNGDGVFNGDDIQCLVDKLLNP